MFRFTTRDAVWMTALVAMTLGWSADRRSYIGSHQSLVQSHATLQQDTTRKIQEIYRRSRSIEEDYAAKDEAAINRELELTTTVRALKLRLGEDPYGK